MPKVEEIYAQLEQESIKLDESIEIIPISLGEDYHDYINEYIEELEKSKAGKDADPRAQWSIYEYVQTRRKEDGIPEPENLNLLIDYITEHRKIKNAIRYCFLQFIIDFFWVHSLLSIARQALSEVKQRMKCEK